MRHVHVLVRPDGIRQLGRIGRLRRWATVGGAAVLGLPATLMIAGAVLAILPVVALAAPTGALVAAVATIRRSVHRHGRRTTRADVVPLHSQTRSS